jgi:glutamate synthase (NADPH/NADH) large chain
LANFEAELSNFTRVLPRDYASVLAIRAKATDNGIDPDSDSVWQEILEVTNG